jgi:type IV secretory pathway VirB6-like protein
MLKFRLINVTSRLKNILSSFFLLVVLNACEPGCVESYQFDSENTYVSAKPIADGIFGGPYNNASGGENADWHKTGLRSNGGQLIIEIRGSWTAWEDGITNQDDVDNLPECTICAKKSGVDNCICKVDEDSVLEKDTFGAPLSGVDCSNDSSNQENPSICTCTTAHGSVNDFGTYLIATDYQEKSESLKLPDQQNPCKYTGGLGLYVGLFGKNGNVMPLRAYQTFPTQKVCDITTTVEGKCIDDSGHDQTKYVYKSPNDTTFIKDDKSGNNGSDTNPSDDEYHVAGEFIKFIINDRYYQDNFGGYDINFMGGFIRDHDSGLLEYIVGTVEDVVLGKISSNGNKREGGAMEFLYNAIVKDSTFMRIVQMCLIMYVVLFGIYVLAGATQVSQAELSKRVIKIGLVIFFTTETSWYFYNQLVVGMFKDGMDAVITIFMNASDKVIDQTSLIITSQIDRANSLSYATRFSYVDEVIKKLLSASTSKKILSLFFGEWFGLLYIPAIYFLIFAFVYIMLTAAFVYITALLRLVFVLCLGPIFMVTSLFNKTDEIFKRWISYMTSQAIQMICLFLILYLFVVLIDVNFNNLLSYRACTKNITFGLIPLNFMIAESNRGLVEWVMSFAKIGVLLFLLKMVMEKIPGFAGQLVTVGGQAGESVAAGVAGANNSAFALARSVMGMATKAAGSAMNTALPFALSKGLDVARATGANKLIPPNPISFASEKYRDYKMDNIINAKRKEGKAQGKSGKDLDAFVRQKSFEELNKQMAVNGNKMNILGMNQDTLAKRLDKKLVEDPLKKAIKDEIKKMKKEHLEKGTEMPLTRTKLNEDVKARIAKWAEENSSIDKSKFLTLLDDNKYGSIVKSHGALSSSEAAEMFAGNEDGANRYLAHLQERQFEKERKRANESKLGKLFGANKIKDAARGLQRKNAYNPKMARENFLRKKQWEEQRMENQSKYGLFKKGVNYLGINPEKTSMDQRINVLDKLHRYDEIAEMARVAEAQTMAAYLKGGYYDEEEKIKVAFDEKVKTLVEQSSEYRKAEADRDAELALAKEKHDYFMQQLGEQHNALKEKADKADSMLVKANLPQDEHGNQLAVTSPLVQEAARANEAFKASQDLLNEVMESDRVRAEEKLVANKQLEKDKINVVKADEDANVSQAAVQAPEANMQEDVDKESQEAAAVPRQKFAASSASKGEGDLNNKVSDNSQEAELMSKKSSLLDKVKGLKIKQGDISAKIKALKLKGKLSEAEERALKALEAEEAGLESDIGSAEQDLSATETRLAQENKN